MENDPNFNSSLRSIEIWLNKKNWDNLSSEIFKVFLKGGNFIHYAMKLYYKYEMYPI